MTDNIIAKTHIGHYTMWHKAVVVDDRRLFLAEDMFCSGYVGGECHKTRHIDEILLPAEKERFISDPIGWMQGASVIQIPIEVTLDHTILPRAIDLTNLEELSGPGGAIRPPSNGVPNYFETIQETFQAVNSEYDRQAEACYLTAGGAINTLCFRTMEVEVKSKFNLGNNLAVFDNKIRTLNQGHFGVNGCYEGARRPRSGFIEAFKDCEYEKQIMKTFG